jgi:hypothetical protein
MNIETKEVYVGTVDKKTEEIRLRKNFGWSYVEDKHHGRSGGLHILLQRDKDMKNYGQVAALENKYDALKKQMKYYSPITDSPEMFLLILVFIFPFVIYCVYKSNQKKAVAENNANVRKQMNEVLNQAQALL